MSEKLKNILLWALTVTLAVGVAFGVNHIMALNKNKEIINTELTFTLRDTNGNTVTMQELVGKPVVINFWAIWCPPCKAEMPDFQKAYDEYGENVTFLFVNLIGWRNNTVAEVDAFMEQNGYDFPVYYDVDGSAEKAVGVTSIPTTVFIDKTGKVTNTYTGILSEILLNNYINQIL